MRLRRQSCALGLAAILVISACTGDDGSEQATDSIASDDVPTVEVPSGQALVEGLPVIEVLGPPEVDAGDRPRFAWSPVADADRYRLVVLGSEDPQWAWVGAATEIYFGGSSVEPPPGWNGPRLDPGSCWSVVALDEGGRVVAVSEFLPVSPGESPGHTCVPGQN